MKSEGKPGKATARYKAVVIGVSAGGFRALSVVLPGLVRTLPLPVLIVQHMSASSDLYLVEHLQQICQLQVKLAEDKETPRAGVIYLAPPDYHLLVEADYSLALSLENRVNYSRPSIDVLFESAAEVYFDSLIGIIMTGASADGARGLMKIKKCGGLTVVQAPETAEADTMPKSAIDFVAVDHIVPLDRLSQFLNTLAVGQ
jgi:two-component system, chemotaxis family, protein-glutamate methylesterase/glutaminase